MRNIEEELLALPRRNQHLIDAFLARAFSANPK
jgi:hypothetical protein